jgi:hypothetical protein
VPVERFEELLVARVPVKRALLNVRIGVSCNKRGDISMFVFRRVIELLCELFELVTKNSKNVYPALKMKIPAPVGARPARQTVL